MNVHDCCHQVSFLSVIKFLLRWGLIDWMRLPIFIWKDSMHWDYTCCTYTHKSYLSLHTNTAEWDYWWHSLSEGDGLVSRMCDRCVSVSARWFGGLGLLWQQRQQKLPHRLIKRWGRWLAKLPWRWYHWLISSVFIQPPIHRSTFLPFPQPLQPRLNIKSVPLFLISR